MGTNGVKGCSEMVTQTLDEAVAYEEIVQNLVGLKSRSTPEAEAIDSIVSYMQALQKEALAETGSG